MDKMLKCGCSNIKKLPQRRIRDAVDKVKYLDIGEIYNLTPYVGCLLSDSVLNLDRFGESFKVHYMNKNNERIDAFMNRILGKVIPLQKWNEDKKMNLWEAQLTANAFLDKGSEMIDNYDDADYIMLSFPFPFNAVAFTFLPSTIYNFPEIFNGKIIVCFNSGILNQLKTVKGSLMYEVMIHELGHTFGLIHPFDGDLGVVMPGLDYFNVFSNRGVYSQNTNLTTVMSYTGYLDENYSEGWSITFNPADMEALRFGYEIKGNNARYLEFMDYGLSLNRMQTYCSDKNGCDLVLVPQSYEGSGFVLDMRKYDANPKRGGGMAGFASGDVGGRFMNICDRQSFIRSIENGYERMTLNLRRIERECVFNTTSGYSFVDVYVEGDSRDWNFRVNEEDSRMYLEDKVTGNSIIFSANNDVYLNYL